MHLSELFIKQRDSGKGKNLSLLSIAVTCLSRWWHKSMCFAPTDKTHGSVYVLPNDMNELPTSNFKSFINIQEIKFVEVEVFYEIVAFSCLVCALNLYFALLRKAKLA